MIGLFKVLKKNLSVSFLTLVVLLIVWHELDALDTGRSAIFEIMWRSFLVDGEVQNIPTYSVYQSFFVKLGMGLIFVLSVAIKAFLDTKFTWFSFEETFKSMFFFSFLSNLLTLFSVFFWGGYHIDLLITILLVYGIDLIFYCVLLFDPADDKLVYEDEAFGISLVFSFIISIGVVREAGLVTCIN